MKANIHSKSILTLVAAASVFLAAQTVEAAQYHVTVDTAALQGSSEAPFALDFQMTGGSALGNTVTLSNFTFGLGGSATSDPAATLFSGVGSGSLASSISLTTNSSNFISELYQGFAPGTILGFDIDLTTNPSGPTPDGFSFAILDKDLFNIQTNGVGDSLLLISINSSNPTVETFTSLNGVSVSVAPVPEPASAAFFGSVVVGALGMVRRRLRAA